MKPPSWFRMRAPRREDAPSGGDVHVRVSIDEEWGESPTVEQVVPPAEPAEAAWTVTAPRLEEVVAQEEARAASGWAEPVEVVVALESRVLDQLADLTAHYGDPWRAARIKFGGNQ